MEDTDTLDVDFTMVAYNVKDDLLSTRFLASRREMFSVCSILRTNCSFTSIGHILSEATCSLNGLCLLPSPVGPETQEVMTIIIRYCNAPSTTVHNINLRLARTAHLHLLLSTNYIITGDGVMVIRVSDIIVLGTHISGFQCLWDTKSWIWKSVGH